MSQALQLVGQVPDLKTEFTFSTDVQEAETTIARAEDIRNYAIYLERQVADLRMEKVRALGDGEAFVRWDEKGNAVRAVKTVVPLTLEENHLYVVQGKVRVTADGYTRLNTFAGITTVTPEEIVVDGMARPNPYIERNPRNGNVIDRVHCRVVALGHSATGNLVALDYRLRFDPTAYFIRDLKQRQRYNPKDVLDMLQSEFDEEKKAGKRRGWSFYAVAPAGDDFVGIAVNWSNKDVADKLKDQTELTLFAERRAQTICRRNALRHHPAIAVTSVQLDNRTVRLNDKNVPIAGRAMIPIWGWVQNASMLAEQQAAIRQIVGSASIDAAQAEQVEFHQLAEVNDAEDDVEATDLDDDFTQDNVPQKERRAPTAGLDDAGPLFGGQD